jgi:excisionase family DNA binding protein
MIHHGQREPRRITTPNPGPVVIGHAPTVTRRPCRATEDHTTHELFRLLRLFRIIRVDEEEAMAGSQAAKRAEPGAIDAEIAARAMRRIKDYLMRHPDEEVIPVTGEIGTEDALVLPREAVSLLAFILAQAAEGRGVSVVPSHAELTTQQAADMLNVSRPYIIQLLESGEIPFRLVGRHRRIRFDDLKTYQQRSEAKSRRAADELTRLGQELGI